VREVGIIRALPGRRATRRLVDHEWEAATGCVLAIAFFFNWISAWTEVAVQGAGIPELACFLGDDSSDVIRVDRLSNRNFAQSGLSCIRTCAGRPGLSRFSAAIATRSVKTEEFCAMVATVKYRRDSRAHAKFPSKRVPISGGCKLDRGTHQVQESRAINRLGSL
jgi:hypothetical protein